MSGKEPQIRPVSPLGRAIKVYLETHHVTQEQLAAIIGYEPRDIRRWKNGEATVTDLYKLKGIADHLGIPYTQLGIPSAIYAPLSLEYIDSTLARIWSLMDAALINDARAVAENLVREVSYQIKTDDPILLHAIARTYHAVAHATASNVRTEGVQQAFDLYHQVEYFARLLEDQTLLNISLTYQGDMLRRAGKIAEATTYLEAARDTTPEADPTARGNNVQLLARIYLQADRESDFDYAIKQAETLALATRQQTEKAVTLYDPTTVYEEHAKGYRVFGKEQQAHDYIDLAEKVRPPIKVLELLLRIARAEILIYNGDLYNGEPLAIQAAIDCRTGGHYRLLERVYALNRYIDREILRYGKAKIALSEALEGPIEH